MAVFVRPAAPAELGLGVLPRHVAIIMDGNGRWGLEQGLSRLDGHRAGTENIRPIIQASLEFGIKVLTLFAFSTENWHRPKQEVRGLLTLLGEVIDREVDALHEQGVRLRHVGTLDGIPGTLRQRVLAAVERTQDNELLSLNVAFNYGGRAEIVTAVRALIAEGTRPEAVTEEFLGDRLYTRGLPDPDLIIRTAGEMRISNFLLWQAAYAEYWCTGTYWPDFSSDEFALALQAYSQRQRRFGRV